MRFRRFLFLPTLLAAASTPYLVLDEQWHPAVKEQLTSLWQQNATGPSDMPRSSVPEPSLPDPSNAIAGAPIADMRDVFRFDITPADVTRRWSRVTTALDKVNLLGLRVPLVTGTKLEDLAGSLTYYFDKNHRVQRISLHATTGDSTRLIALATEKMHMDAEPSLGAGVYLKRWNGRPVSVLRISHAPIVRADEPHTQLRIEMEVNRGDLAYGLSDQFQYIMLRDRAIGRW